MRLSMFIPGVPIAQPRPRITVRGKHGVAYVPRDHAIHEWRAKIKDMVQRRMGPCRPIIGRAIHVKMEFYLARPKSNRQQLPISRPDLDNLAKAVLDAVNGVIWGDDSQVTTVVMSKRWHNNQGLWLEISEDTE